MKTHGCGIRHQVARRGDMLRWRILGFALVAAGMVPTGASAQSGTWTQAATGSVWNWGDAGNWSGGVVANGANNSATFAPSGMTSGLIVNLDTARTIGTITFDDPSGPFGWTLQGTNTLTLSNAGGASITVNNSGGTATNPVTATISTPISGSFTKAGAGTLLLTGSSPSLTGVTVTGGIVGATTNGTTNPLGTGTITLGGGTLRLGDSSGYNQKMVVPVGTTFANSGVTATMDTGTALVNYTWYALGQNTAAPLTGLPSGTTITSAAGTGYQYALPAANTTTNNTLLMDATHPTGKLVLATPTSGLSTISFLTSSGNVGIAAGAIPPVITATIHYTNGTADATGLTFTSPDWFTTTTSGQPGTPAYLTGGRLGAPGYANVVNPPTATSFPNLFDESITNPNPSSPVGSIDLSWAVGTGGTQTTIHTAIMAIGTTGAAIPIVTNPGQMFTNNVAVTADSAIDVETSAGAGVGNLTIGSNTLSVTAGTKATPTLAIGAITMTGNPIFNVGAGISVTQTGALTDGGTVRTVTKTGQGTIAFSSASPGLQAGTGVSVSAGTLNLNNATAFGASPAVTINGGNLNLGASINPTFGSLNGGGGVLSLNGNTVTLGSTTGSFGGSISDGTAPGSVIKSGSGTQTLTGTSTFTGGTTVSTGTLVAGPGSLGTGTVTLTGGNLAVGPTQVPSNTFGGTGVGWTANGSASFTAAGPANTLQLTPAAGGTGSAWFNTPVTVQPFTAKFTMTNALNATSADGFTFGFQNNSLNAIGGGGGLLGYGNQAGSSTNVTPSAVFEVNIYAPNTTGGVGSGVGFLRDGAAPNAATVPPTAPVNAGAFNSPTNFVLTWNGTTASVTMTQGASVFTFSQPFDFSDGGALTNAFLGFTGATGGVLSQQQITNFSYTSASYSTPTAPAAGTYTNNVALTNSSTITVTAPTGVPTVVMSGTLSLGAGNTLTINPDPTNPANAPYGLVFSGTTLNGANTINVTNNGTALTSLTLGALTDSTGTSSLTVTGNPALSITGGTIGGRFSLGSSNLSLGGASLTVGSLVGTGGTLSGNATTPITLTIGSDNTSTTYAGNIVDGSTGSLALTKTGTGTLTLTGTNTYSGGTSVLNGTLAVASDGSLGSGPVSITALSTLSYSASTSTNKSFTLGGGTLAVNGGATLTLNGSTIISGFLGGSGTFATSATSGARFGNATSLPSVTITSNNGADQFVNFTNGGALTVAPNIVGTTLTGVTNQGSGAITIGAVSSVNVSGFESYGTFTINPAVVGSNQETLVTNTGSSAMFFNGGSRTFVGTPATATSGGLPTFVAGMNLAGKNVVIAGGLFVNNGAMSDFSSGTHGQIIVDFGALYKGAGFTGVSIVTQNGGRVQAGNSPGGASYGQFVFGPGGVSNYVFNINDATGAAGPTPDAAGHVSGWGLVSAVKQAVGSVMTSGNFSWTASPNSPVNVAIDTLLNPTMVGNDVPGAMANFNPYQSYSWPAAEWAGTYTGPTTVAALDASTTFDTSGFVNPVSGTFGWDLNPSDQTLSLTYTPSAVPEPGTFVLTAAGLAWVIGRRRKSRRVVVA